MNSSTTTAEVCVCDIYWKRTESMVHSFKFSQPRRTRSLPGTYQYQLLATQPPPTVGRSCGRAWPSSAHDTIACAAPSRSPRAERATKMAPPSRALKMGGGIATVLLVVVRAHAGGQTGPPSVPAPRPLAADEQSREKHLLQRAHPTPVRCRRRRAPTQPAVVTSPSRVHLRPLLLVPFHRWAWPSHPCRRKSDA